MMEHYSHIRKAAKREALAKLESGLMTLPTIKAPEPDSKFSRLNSDYDTIHGTTSQSEASGAELESGVAALPLKGHAIELWWDHAGERVFIVADEEDAQEAIRRFGAHRGEFWIPVKLSL
jgi:hypothetical protein